VAAESELGRIRLLVGIVIIGLVISGVTAFPLQSESVMLDHFVRATGLPAFVTNWTATVRGGLARAYADYPFLAYGTDWLAFGHLVIALFLIGAYRDPIRNVWLIRAAMLSCILVVPVALICGEIRHIPLWWRAIDSSFGVVGLIPLWLADRLIPRLDGA
jgi:hypothetical protein